MTKCFQRLLGLVLLTWCMVFPAMAQTTPVEVITLQVQREDDGLHLSYQIKFELPAAIEAALLKGVAVHFVAQTQVNAYRWYWYDKKINAAVRQMRLAYQPLTRRWRLNVSTEGNASLSGSLSQNFDSLSEALLAVQRNTRWKIAELSDVAGDTLYWLDFEFKLDVSQLPRPLQIGLGGQSDWKIAVRRTQRLSSME